MKKLIFAIFIIFNSSHADEFFCAYPTAKKASKIIKEEIAPMAYDKYVHCAVSCSVGVICGSTSSAFIGLAKEAYDIVGPGNLEYSDMLANFKGISISMNNQVNSVSACSHACKQAYPKYNYSKGFLKTL